MSKDPPVTQFDFFPPPTFEQRVVEDDFTCAEIVLLAIIGVCVAAPVLAVLYVITLGLVESRTT